MTDSGWWSAELSSGWRQSTSKYPGLDQALATCYLTKYRSPSRWYPCMSLLEEMNLSNLGALQSLCPASPGSRYHPEKHLVAGWQARHPRHLKVWSERFLKPPERPGYPTGSIFPPGPSGMRSQPSGQSPVLCVCPES